MKRTLIALLFLLVASVVQAQEDFPPPGIYIPCCYGSGTGHTGATYGRNGQSAWRQVWGASPGDVVTFRFVLRTSSAGSLHAWPQTTSGHGMTYLGDETNPYEKWYWNTGERSSGGTFCIDCPWQFVADAYNPWIYIDYWDSGDGWDVDLNVTSIQTRLASVRQETKDKAVQYGTASAWFGQGMAVAAALSFAAGNYPLFGLFSAGSIGSLGLAFYFDRIANDPWDDNYASPFIAYFTADTDFIWACQAVQDWDVEGWLASACWGYVDAFIYATSYAQGIAVTADRIESCALIGDPCQVWQRDWLVAYFHATGAWLRVVADYHYAFYVYLSDRGDTDNAYAMWYYAMNMYDAADHFEAIQ